MKVILTHQTALIDIYRRIQRNHLVLPPHQRKDVWPGKRKEEWFVQVKRGGQISGMVTTYSIEDSNYESGGPKVLYINDGAQRLFFALPALRALFISQAEFEEVLIDSYITEQQVIYADEKEAIKEFFALNATGTMCTPYELTRGIFVAGLKNYTTVWSPIFDSIKVVVNTAIDRVGCKQEDENTDREKTHKRYRDNLGLFHRFITGDKSKHRAFKVGSAHIDMGNWEKETALETDLCSIFATMGPEKVKKAVKDFGNVITQYTTFYRQIWSELSPKLTAPANVHFRWWLLIALLFKNINVNIEVLREFTQKLIVATGGKSTIYYKTSDGVQKNCNAGLGSLNILTVAIKALGMSWDQIDGVKIRDRDNTILLPGAAHSHINAFSAYGNGPTLPENSLENSKRVNRDMTREEIDRLTAL